MHRVGVGMVSLVLLASAPPPPPAEHVVTGDGIAEVTVNGEALRLRIDPAAPGLPLVTLEQAQRLGLKSGMIGINVSYVIGKERVSGSTGVVRFGWAGGTAGKRRIGWITRSYPTAVDGTIGPTGLEEPVVRFALRPARPGEQVTVLPMMPGGIAGDWKAASASILVEGKPVIVRFDPRHRLSTATAPAAALLARTNGGLLTATTDRQEVAYGVERPLRVMSFTRPFMVGALALPTIAVRVTDGGGGNALPQEGDDPNEVVVTAKGEEQPGIIRLGGDRLDRCSSLVFDRTRKEIRLSCLPG